MSNLPDGYGSLMLNMQRPAEPVRINDNEPVEIATFPSWRDELSLHSNDAYIGAMDSIHWQGNETCYFCGFPDAHFLEIHHLNGNHNDYQDENLVLACSLCHRQQHLGWVAMKSMGKMVFLPQLPIGQPRLELVALLNREYLLQSNLPAIKRDILSNLALSQSINEYLGRFQRYDFDAVYRLRKQHQALINTEIDELANLSGEDKVNQNKKINALRNMVVTRESLDQWVVDNDAEKARIKAEKALNPDGKTPEKNDKEIKIDTDKGIRATDTKTANELAREEMTAKANSNGLEYLSGDIPLIDLVLALNKCDENYRTNLSFRQQVEKNPCDYFFDSQRDSSQGRLGVWFNESVFEPIYPSQYTLRERIRYYQTNEVQQWFSPDMVVGRTAHILKNKH